jgi:antitoxin ChpS
MFDRIGETMFHETMYHLFNNALHKVMRMEVILRKCGNSTVLSFPPAVLKDLGLKAGQTMTLNTTSDGRITLVPKRRHKLADFIPLSDIVGDLIQELAEREDANLLVSLEI